LLHHARPAAGRAGPAGRPAGTGDLTDGDVQHAARAVRVPGGPPRGRWGPGNRLQLRQGRSRRARLPGERRMKAMIQGAERVHLRIAVLGMVFLSLIVALVLRLWFLQVLSVDSFRKLADQNYVRVVPKLAARGRILDR